MAIVYPDRRDGGLSFEEVSVIMTDHIRQLLNLVYEDADLQGQALESLFVRANTLNGIVRNPADISILLKYLNCNASFLPNLQNIALGLINNPNQIRKCSESAKKKRLTKNILIYAINSVFREHQILMPPDYTIHIDRPYYKIELSYTGDNILYFVNEILKKFHFIDFSLSAFSFTLNKQKFSYILTIEDRREKNDIIHTYGRNS